VVYRVFNCESVNGRANCLSPSLVCRRRKHDLLFIACSDSLIKIAKSSVIARIDLRQIKHKPPIQVDGPILSLRCDQCVCTSYQVEGLRLRQAFNNPARWECDRDVVGIDIRVGKRNGMNPLSGFEQMLFVPAEDTRRKQEAVQSG
jgi:hypothetical protein